MKTRTKAGLAVLALAVLAAGAALYRARGGGAASTRDEEASAEPGPRGGAATPGPRRLAAGEPDPPPADSRPLALVTARTELDPDARAGAIEGRVVNWSSGEPVAGAEMSLALDGDATTSVLTASDGRFRFEPARPGRVVLASITAAGFLPFAPEWGHSPIELWARPGVRVRDVVICLTPAIDYTGVVVSPDGAPVAGAEVRIIDLPGGEQEIVTIRDRFRTDRRGEFTFHAPDFALLEAVADGFGPGRARLDGAAQSSHRLVIRLTAAEDGATLGSVRIEGMVVDAAGLPLPGVVVRAEPMRRPAGAGAGAAPPAPARGGLAPDLRATARAVTGDDGRFSLAGLDPGAYRVVARDGERASADAEVVAAAGETRRVRLAMTAGAVVSGTVVDASGEPVPAFTVVVSRAVGIAARPVAVRTVIDREGRFSIDGLEEGEVLIEATAHGHAPSPRVTARAEVPPRRGSPVELRLTDGATLTGVVRSAGGGPIENARVSVEHGLGGAPARSRSPPARSPASAASSSCAAWRPGGARSWSPPSATTAPFSAA